MFSIFSFEGSLTTHSEPNFEQLIYFFSESDLPAFFLTIGAYALMYLVLGFARKVVSFLDVMVKVGKGKSLKKFIYINQFLKLMSVGLKGHFALFSAVRIKSIFF